MKHTGVTARGIITPIFKKGDDLVAQVCDAVINAASAEGYGVDDGDIIALTESIVARTQGNYATCSQIAKAVEEKFGNKEIGLVFPIQSRNRFSMVLKSISMVFKKVYVQLSFPSDEVGNQLITQDLFDRSGVNPVNDNFDEQQFRDVFNFDTVHTFTGVDYIKFYKSFGDNIEIIFSNDPTYILNYTKNILCCDVHTRHRTKNLINQKGADVLCTLDDILTQSIDGSGYNPQFGLLGSNMASDESVKLFPRDSAVYVQGIQSSIYQRTGKKVEVLVYGDGCFKDPVGGIWEFYDPVVAPAYTSGLEGTPSEIKIKYVADNEFADLSGEDAKQAVKNMINEKSQDIKGANATLGTTPRRYTDLIGSLCDLVSGSGDRGTPVVHIKGYFSNFASE